MIRALPLLMLIACTGPSTEDSDPSTDDSGTVTDSGTETGLTGVPCTNFSEAGSGDVNELPTLLSETGCVESSDNWTVVDSLLPYDINAPFWSDNAVKTRFVAIPDGGKISIYTDGDLEFPAGTTLMKHFMLDGKKIETRLFIKLPSLIWVGASYQWDEAETDATLLTTSVDRVIGTQTWSYPAPSDCTFCHAAAAGGSLGPEIGQLNKDFAYADGTMNQISKWNANGWFEENPGDPTGLDVYADPTDSVNFTVDERARAYLHTNCSQCHRPGGASHLPMDWRIASPLDDKTCDTQPNNPGTIGVDARILAPGDPANSIMHVRMGDENWRMPPVGSNVLDTDGMALIGEWINSITSCPTN